LINYKIAFFLEKFGFSEVVFRNRRLSPKKNPGGNEMRNVQSGVTSRKQYGQAKKAPQLVEHVAIDTAKCCPEGHILCGARYLVKSAISNRFWPSCSASAQIRHTNRLNRLSYCGIFFRISAISQSCLRFIWGFFFCAGIPPL
jgi:hypothetical protein